MTTDIKLATPPASDAAPQDHESRLADARRLAALDSADVMDTAPEEAFDRVVRLATHIIGVPVGLVSFVDDKRQFFKAHKGLPDEMNAAPQTPLSHSFCQYVVSTDAPLAIEDARRHPLVTDNLAIPDLGVVAYLGVPIHSPEGIPLGSLCAIDASPRSWSSEDLQALQDLTAMLETELRLRHERQSMRLLAHELNHRVKNLFTITGGMISMTARAADSPAAMADALHGRLSALSAAHNLVSTTIVADALTERAIDLATLISRLLEPHVTGTHAPAEIDVPDLSLQGRAVADMALVLHELATNAAKYGALSTTEGRLAITGTVDGDTVRLEWRETGGPEVAEAPATRGFGSRLIDMTVSAQFGGTLDSDWQPTGVSHRLTLPRKVFAAG